MRSSDGRAWGDITFRAGDIVSSVSGTFFLIDDMKGKLIARGFLEGDTYDALVGMSDPPYVPDAAFSVLDGYEAIASGSCLAHAYGSETIWFVDGNRARGIVSGEAFAQYHFNEQDVQTWSDAALQALANDPDLYIRVSDRTARWLEPSPKMTARFDFRAEQTRKYWSDDLSAYVYSYELDSRFSVGRRTVGVVDWNIPNTDISVELSIGQVVAHIAGNGSGSAFHGQEGSAIRLTCPYQQVGQPFVLAGTLNVAYWAEAELLINRESGKALEVELQNVSQDGARVRQSAQTAGGNQQWAHVGWSIMNVESRKVLDVELSEIDQNGAKVQQWTDNGTRNQQWEIVDAGGGWVWLRNAYSGKALDVRRSRIQEDGVPLQQWDYAATPNQQWKRVAAYR